MPRDNHLAIKAEDWDRIFGKKGEVEEKKIGCCLLIEEMDIVEFKKRYPS